MGVWRWARESRLWGMQMLQRKMPSWSCWGVLKWAGGQVGNTVRKGQKSPRKRELCWAKDGGIDMNARKYLRGCMLNQGGFKLRARDGRAPARTSGSSRARSDRIVPPNFHPTLGSAASSQLHNLYSVSHLSLSIKGSCTSSESHSNARFNRESVASLVLVLVVVIDKNPRECPRPQRGSRYARVPRLSGLQAKQMPQQRGLVMS